MAKENKGDNINKNYPMLGYRVMKLKKELMEKLLDETIEILRKSSESIVVGSEKRNKVFLRALEIGLKEIKKNRTLE